jgi:arylsulfatase A-like enzyme
MKFSKLSLHLTKNCQVVFFVGTYLAYLTYLLVIYSDGGGKGAWHIIAKILTPAVELGFYLILSCLLFKLWKRKKFIVYKILYLSIPLLVAILYAVQVYSLHISGNFISVLAIENHAESRLIEKVSLYPLLAAALIWWVLHVICCAKRAGSGDLGVDEEMLSVKEVVAITAILFFAQIYLFRTQESYGLIGAGYRQVPVASISFNYFEYLKSKRLYPTRKASDVLRSTKKFPLESKDIYESALPFAKVNGTLGPQNVIVIFTEGMSATLLGSYGSGHQGISPNIDALAKKSMRVINYYNHTAATYRGLQGQMVSGYPRAGGSGTSSAWESGDRREVLSKIHYKSVPMILRDMNYRTYFMSPHHDSVALNTLLRSLAFDRVYSYESISRELHPDSNHMTAGSLSDEGLFNALRNLLSSSAFQASKKPFFIGTYNIGTHAFLDVDAADKKYGDGSNPVLNRMHNYDYQLGKFLDYFFASRYAKNTVLIFTADHSTYPDSYFRKVVSPYYRPYFVGEIPLLIYDPARVLPRVYDVRGRTSIDFAPTLLQLLGVKKDYNSFVGTSLFEPNGLAFGVAALGNEFFATDSEAVYYENQIPPKYQKEFNEQTDMIKKYYTLESEDRVFQPAN